MAEENPYSQMIDTMKSTASGQFTDAWRIGKVVSSSPVTVDIGGIIIAGRDLYVNEMLIDYEREIEIQLEETKIEGKVDCDAGSITGMDVQGGELKGKAKHKNILKSGDSVVLLQSSDGQKYVVLCKVV